MTDYVRVRRSEPREHPEPHNMDRARALLKPSARPSDILAKAVELQHEEARIAALERSGCPAEWVRRSLWEARSVGLVDTEVLFGVDVLAGCVYVEVWRAQGATRRVVEHLVGLFADSVVVVFR